ncbi:MAG: BMP family protein [Rhodobacteraceae bacterium]|nr:BMP family protein [Paracoccaceae bacterium]
MKIAIFFVGKLDDAGFNSSALAGVRAAEASNSIEIKIVADVRYDQAEIRERLEEVLPAVDGLVFIGGQGNAFTPEMAERFPEKLFAIVQGERVGPNLSSYDVRQEESAFLAGYLAARMTRTGVVAHLSGHRVLPGLKGRAAYVAGALYADPSVTVLTGFCGTQDDNGVAGSWADAMIGKGADVLFTMLNGARQGAIDACKAGGTRQIGNALDWCAEDPDVFVASAIARIDLGVETAISDMLQGVRRGEVMELGLSSGDYVSLSFAPDVADHLRQEIAGVADEIRSGALTLPTHYGGVEFELEAASCQASA